MVGSILSPAVSLVASPSVPKILYAAVCCVLPAHMARNRPDEASQFTSHRGYRYGVVLPAVQKLPILET